MKKKEGLSIVKQLCADADVLIEPFRAGMFTQNFLISCFTYGFTCLGFLVDASVFYAECITVDLYMKSRVK